MSLRRGIVWLMGGAGVGGALGLAGLLVATHALSGLEFGALAVTQGLGAVFRLVTVQPWQALVRYLPGSPTPGTLVGAAWVIDQTCALAAGLALAAVLLVAPGLVGLRPDLALATLPLALGVALQAADPWTGLLLQGGRQELLARVQVGAAVIRLAALGLAASLGGGLHGIVLAHLLGDLTWTAGMAWAAWPLRPPAVTLPWRCSSWRDLRRDHPGISHLAVTTTGTSLLSGAGAQADVPLVSAIGDPVVAGTWRLIRSLANLLMILASPLRQALLAHVAAGRSLAVGTWVGTLAAGGLVLGTVMAFVGEPLLSVALGSSGRGLALPVGIALAGAALNLAGLPLVARLVVAGAESRVLWSALVAVPAYLAALVLTGDRVLWVAIAFAGHQALGLMILILSYPRISAEAGPQRQVPPG